MKTILITIFISLLSIEILLRITIPFLDSKPKLKKTYSEMDLITFSNDQSLGYKLTPNQKIIFKDQKFQTNDEGFVRSDKTPSEISILGIGDSVMMGWGIDQRKHFINLLEEKLKKDNLIAGVLGYNSKQNRLNMEKILKNIRPKCVFYLHVGNDYKDNYNFYKKLPINSYSYLINGLQIFYLKVLQNDKSSFSYEHLNNIENNFDPKKEIEKSAIMLQNKGIKTLFILDSRYQSSQLRHFEVEKIVKRFDHSVIDLYAILRSKDNFNLGTSLKDEHNELYLIHKFENDTHPNEKWHNKVLEIVYPFARENCL